MSQANPYQPVSNSDLSSTGYVQSLDVKRLITSPFVSPNWMMNFVWMFISVLLSIVLVGSMVMFGYMADVIRARSGGRADQWPDFKSERFSDYLSRGVWPFVWLLLASFVVSAVLLIPFMFLAVVVAMLGDAGAIVIFLASIASIPITIIASLVFVGILLKTLYIKEFGEGWDPAFVKSFATKTFVPFVVGILVLSLVSMVAGAVSLVTCGVGYIFAVPYVQLVVMDFYAQLNDIHMSKGGQSPFPVHTPEIY